MESLTGFTKQKILLVEDNVPDARLIEIYLQESDLVQCDIQVCRTLQQSLQLLGQEDDFAVVLLDLFLPDSRGIDTLESVMAAFPKANVIAVTGAVDKYLGIQAVKAGAQDFLVKGAFDADQLARALRFSIERRNILHRLEETQRIAHIGSWEYHLERKELQVSEEVYRILGLPVDENAKIQEAQFSKEGTPFHVFAKVLSDLSSKTSIQGDFYIQTPEQSNLIVFISAKRNYSGESVHGIFQDITYRKQTEQEVSKSRKRYQDIFRLSKDSIYISTLEGKLLDFNPSIEELSGFSAEELHIMHNVHQLFYPKEKRNEFLLKLKMQGEVKEFEIQVRRKDNEMRSCLITAYQLRSENELDYTGIIRDITVRKQAEELRKARDLAYHTAKMKEQFVASVSHEMRTPMNAILGMSNLVAQTSLNDQQQTYIRHIRQASEILLGIVNDILQISLMRHGKMQFENQPFDLQEQLQFLIDAVAPKAAEKNLDLQLSIGSNVPFQLRGDKIRLFQILSNLIGNAIKFTDAGSVKLTVEKLFDISVGVQLQFSVADTGIGIPDDHIDAIFESFSRVQYKDRIYEGAGLGLAITKSLIEQQGGKMGLKSKEGEGSVFYFDMIFVTNDGHSPIEEQGTPTANKEDFRLLLVEDHQLNQVVARKTLEREWPGIQIVIAENGQIALDRLQEEDFDIILMDIQMPVMDGYEAIKRIRNDFHPPKSTIPVLAMTAHTHLMEGNQFRQYGWDDYVLKPFRPEELYGKIRTHVHKRTADGNAEQKIPIH